MQLPYCAVLKQSQQTLLYVIPVMHFRSCLCSFL
uniref:Uncharacterized protein n=1 Tax=Arundo donax TaxID=35708 RepID=A0A0A9FP80_ARUDO